MRYGSVCSGIEAATMAWHPLGWTPAFFSEIEAFPSAVLAHHYGSNMPGEPLAKNGIPNYGDFTQIGAEAGPIDLLVGGTPCQSFSVAGKRLGLDDPRGNLALEYLSLARRLRARWIVWENVPGVVSSVTDEEDGESGVQPGIEGREAGDEWIEESDFATFLSFVRECGYGFAYRVLDAQYVRVDGFERAVPQRRRRVFVVGYLGDWRRAAAVLLEPQGMRGDIAPRREQGKGTAGTIDASAARSRGAGVSPGMVTAESGVVARDVAPTLNAAFGSKLGLENQHIDGGAGMFVAHTLLGKENSSHQADRETYIAFDCKASGQNGFGVGEIAPTLRAMGHLHGNQNAGGQIAVAFGGDVARSPTARHDGSPCADRGMDVVAIQAGALRTNPNSGPDGVGVQEGISYTLEARSEVQAVAYGLATSVTPKFAVDISPTLTVPSPTGGGQPAAVAYDMRGRNGGAQFEGPHETANIRAASGGSSKSYVAQEWAVRRLTPTECERLQGFPDNFTNVPWGKKDTSPDGPRYKALGNSMACNVMRWIGRRIEMVEKITKDTAA